MRPGRIVLVAGAAALAASCAARWPSGTGAGAGAAATRAGDWRQVTVTGLGGEQRTLPALLGGRPALVNLWAPWCPSCVREMPRLDRIAKHAAGCGAAVVAVAVGESPASLAAFPRTRTVAYPVYTDPGFALADALGRRQIPATLVVDKGGRIVFEGAAVDPGAVSALESALGPRPSVCGLSDAF